MGEAVIVDLLGSTSAWTYIQIKRAGIRTFSHRKL
jgi:hypothetical protein